MLLNYLKKKNYLENPEIPEFRTFFLMFLIVICHKKSIGIRGSQYHN